MIRPAVNLTDRSGGSLTRAFGLRIFSTSVSSLFHPDRHGRSRDEGTPNGTMARRTETLARIGLFRSLTEAAVKRLDTQCAWRRATAREWILDYKDQSADLYFVVQGHVRVLIQAGSGKDSILREIRDGDFFGELAAIDGLPRSAAIL